MKPTLFILAAGMGSRYGGLKQLDGVGPSGETIMDYSIFDAVRAGFGKVVFVIRHDFEEEFREKVLSKYEKVIPVAVCFQTLDNLPKGFKCPEGRTKPWGTNHAVLMAKDIIHEPFAVINSDDFYGRNAFEVLAGDLVKMSNTEGDYSMVGYRVGNTLSESGTVNRGVCTTNAGNFLTGVTERINIGRNDKGEIVYPDGDTFGKLDENAPVSMNMWGFTPDYFEHSEKYFIDFLKNNLTKEKSEFFIPLVVNDLITKGKARCRVLDTTSKWFGVTYTEDRPAVVEKLASLVKEGEYPTPLFR